MKRLTFHCPDDVLDQITEMADEEFEGNRSLVIVRAIRYYFEKSGGKEKMVSEQLNAIEGEIYNLKSRLREFDSQVPGGKIRREREMVELGQAIAIIEYWFESKPEFKLSSTHTELVNLSKDRAKGPAIEKAISIIEDMGWFDYKDDKKEDIEWNTVNTSQSFLEFEREYYIRAKD